MYDFQGEPNKVFALISEPHVQVNARFVDASDIVHAKKGNTVMGDICVRFCDSIVAFDSKGSVHVSGPSSSNLIVNRRSNTTTDVTVGLWSLTVELDKKHGVEKIVTRHLHPFLNLKSVKLQHPLFAGPIHGVLGVTAGVTNWIPTHAAKGQKARHPHCNPKNEGACEVPGEWRDYEVKNNDLCGTEFKFSKFDRKNCASTSKRGAPEVNLLQRAQQAILV